VRHTGNTNHYSMKRSIAMQSKKEKTMKTKDVSRRLRRFARASEAVSALEYAILVGIIAVVLATAITTFSGNIKTAITNIGTSIQGTTSATPDADGS